MQDGVSLAAASARSMTWLMLAPMKAAATAEVAAGDQCSPVAVFGQISDPLANAIRHWPEFRSRLRRPREHDAVDQSETDLSFEIAHLSQRGSGTCGITLGVTKDGAGIVCLMHNIVSPQVLVAPREVLIGADGPLYRRDRLAALDAGRRRIDGAAAREQR
jgi:hypothetical protein